jgi:uncharacterized MAPEG superfamily protein
LKCFEVYLLVGTLIGKGKRKRRNDETTTNARHASVPKKRKESAMSHPEIFWLTATALLTGALWVPYILNRLYELRPIPAIRSSEPDPEPLAKWARRSMAAHRNAYENIGVFAALVLALHVVGAHTPLTATAAMVYFFVRIAHAIIYTVGVPWLRTPIFLLGFAMQVIIGLAILDRLVG